MQRNVKWIRADLGRWTFAFFLIASAPALAQHCAPTGETWSAEKFGLASDPAYQNARDRWAAVLKGRREIEGKNSSDCTPPNDKVDGYEGFPVIECRYESDGGDDRKKWPRISAKARSLNPSVDQLAAWSVNACRDNGRTGAADLANCLSGVVKGIWTQNNAQFPLSGIVIERRCDVSNKDCKNTSGKDPLRQPLLMSFRDGITSASPALSFGTPKVALSDDIYQKLFDEPRNALHVKSRARIASVLRDHWQAWRAAQPSGSQAASAPANADGVTWLTISRDVHKRACSGDRNDLIAAAVKAGVYQSFEPSH